MLSDEALLLLKPSQDSGRQERKPEPSFAGVEEVPSKEEEREGRKAGHTAFREKADSAQARQGGGNSMPRMPDEAERLRLPDGMRDEAEAHGERDEGDEGEYSSSISRASTFPSPSASSPMGCAGGATADGGWGFTVETYERICVMLRGKAQELNQELLLRTARCVLCGCAMSNVRQA